MEIDLTAENFQSTVESHDKVLVDFWATWCGPCRMLSPVLAEIAGERGDVTVGKVNVDEEPALATRFGITSIPTLIVFTNGQPKATSVGCIPKEGVLSLIDSV